MTEHEVGDRVYVSDEWYTGPALIMEIVHRQWATADQPWFCHLLDLCDHEMCEIDDDCDSEECRGWYGPNDVQR